MVREVRKRMERDEKTNCSVKNNFKGKTHMGKFTDKVYEVETGEYTNRQVYYRYDMFLGRKRIEGLNKGNSKE